MTATLIIFAVGTANYVIGYYVGRRAEREAIRRRFARVLGQHEHRDQA